MKSAGICRISVSVLVFIAMGAMHMMGEGELSSAAALTNNGIERTLQIGIAAGSGLVSYVCKEEINRFKAGLQRDKAKQIDKVTLNVSFEGGQEKYTDILVNERRIHSLDLLRGAWSSGEYGTVLNQTLTLFQSRSMLFHTKTTLNGRPALLYTVDTKANNSPWKLVVGQDVHLVGFRTQVWASADSGEVLRIARTSLDIPSRTGIQRIQWVIDFAPTGLDGSMVMLPKTAEYSVFYPGQQEWNVITFSGYRRFSAESILRFDW